jgi:hypothetical protein
MAIKFEKKTNIYFHGDRNTKNICWDFTLEMGLVLYMVFCTSHGQVPSPMYIKVEVLNPTPHPKPTPINASQLPTLYYLEPYPAV